MSIRSKSKKGFSLVELVLATGLFVFIFASGLIFLHSYSQGTTRVQWQAKTQQKLRNISEAIRYESAANFFNMTETLVNRTGSVDPEIQIFSTISPINPTSNSRQVTLLAKRTVGNNGSGQVIQASMTFTITRTRAKLPGGVIRIRVVKKGTNEGIPDVLVTTLGMDIPEVTGKTNAYGVAQIYGVLPKEDPQEIWLDGTLVRAYFEPDINNPFLGFKRKIFATGVSDGVLSDLGTHEIVPPGSLSGTVLDVTTNLPIPGVYVYAVPQSGSVPIIEDADIETTTDQNGQFHFHEIINGDYYVVVVGNMEYAAVDNNNSAGSAMSRTPLHTVIAGEDLNVGALYTIKKGSWQGQFREVVFDPNLGEYIDFGPAEEGVGVNFWTFSKRIYYEYPIPQNYHSYEILDSAYGKSYQQAAGGFGAGFILSSGYPAKIQGDSNGNYTVMNQTAYAIHKDMNAYPYENQFNGMYPKVPSYYHNNAPPSSVLPVLVRNPGDPSTQYISVKGNYSWEIRLHPDDNFYGSWAHPIYTNGLANPANTGVDIYFVKNTNENLANASGTISFNGTPPDPSVFSNPQSRHYVTIPLGRENNSSGPLLGIGLLTEFEEYQSVTFDGNQQVETLIDVNSPYNHTYDLKFNNGNYRVFPTWPFEPQRVEFQARGPVTTETDVEITGPILGYYKTSSDPFNLVPYQPLDLPEAGQEGLDLTFLYYYDGEEMSSDDSIGVSVNAGTMTLTRDLVHWSAWTGTTYYAFAPGEDAVLNIVASENTVHPTYTIEAITNSDWQMGEEADSVNIVWDEDLGKYVLNAPLIITKRGDSGPITGSVTSANGDPIYGATVELYGSGFDTLTYTCTGSDNTFSFPSINFVMVQGANIKLRVLEATGYNVPTPYVDFGGFEGISIDYTFVLQALESEEGGGSEDAPGGL